MGSEIPCQFNQKRGLTICAKWDTSQNQSRANHAADRSALGGESGNATYQDMAARLTILLPTLAEAGGPGSDGLKSMSRSSAKFPQSLIEAANILPSLAQTGLPC